ncbi:hypothetical protein PCE1_004207 [Barthelona sp. PCE]
MWQEIIIPPEGPKARMGCTLTWVGQSFCVLIGGYTSTPANTAERSWIYDVSRNSWFIIPPGPDFRSNHCAVVYEQFLYVFGGRSGAKDVLCDTWILNLETFEWTEVSLTDQFTPRSHMSCSLLGNKLVMYGGVDTANGHVFDDMWFLDCSVPSSEQQWLCLQKHTDGIEPRFDHVSFTCGAFLFIHGGYNQHRKICSDMFVLDPVNIRFFKVATQSIDGQSPHLHLASHSVCSLSEQSFLICGGQRNAQRGMNASFYHFFVPDSIYNLKDLSTIVIDEHIVKFDDIAGIELSNGELIRPRRHFGLCASDSTVYLGFGCADQKSKLGDLHRVSKALLFDSQDESDDEDAFESSEPSGLVVAFRDFFKGRSPVDDIAVAVAKIIDEKTKTCVNTINAAAAKLQTQMSEFDTLREESLAELKDIFDVEKLRYLKSTEECMEAVWKAERARENLISQFNSVESSHAELKIVATDIQESFTTWNDRLFKVDVELSGLKELGLKHTSQIEDLNIKNTDTLSSFDTVNSDIKTLEKTMYKRFVESNEDIMKMGNDLTALTTLTTSLKEKNLAMMSEKINLLDEEVSTVKNNAKSMADQLEKLEQLFTEGEVLHRLERMTEGMADADSQIAQLQNRVNSVDGTLDSLGIRMDNFDIQDFDFIYSELDRIENLNTLVIENSQEIGKQDAVVKHMSDLIESNNKDIVNRHDQLSEFVRDHMDKLVGVHVDIAKLQAAIVSTPSTKETAIDEENDKEKEEYIEEVHE